MKNFIYDLVYVFLNYVVAYIPSWNVRKMFYRLFGLKIGKGSRVCMRAVVFSPWKIVIGENTMINEYAILDGRGGLKIGSNCSISMRSVVYTETHLTISPEFETYKAETTLKDGVWICYGAVVLPGSVLENNCIVGAQSVYKGKSEDRGVYIGNPASLVKIRNIKEIKMRICNHMR